jgi:hypothetical protein
MSARVVLIAHILQTSFNVETIGRSGPFLKGCLRWSRAVAAFEGALRTWPFTRLNHSSISSFEEPEIPQIFEVAQRWRPQSDSRRRPKDAI